MSPRRDRFVRLLENVVGRVDVLGHVAVVDEAPRRVGGDAALRVLVPVGHAAVRLHHLAQGGVDLDVVGVERRLAAFDRFRAGLDHLADAFHGVADLAFGGEDRATPWPRSVPSFSVFSDPPSPGPGLYGFGRLDDR